MRFFGGGSSWILAAAFAVQQPPPPPSPPVTPHNVPVVVEKLQVVAPPEASSTRGAVLGDERALLQQLLLANNADDTVEPSEDDVQLLRRAFAEFYATTDGPNNRDHLTKSYDLLTQVVNRWNELKQPDDEIAGLYRVRGDCNMLLSQPKQAYEDYDQAIKLIEGPGGGGADPTELPAAYLGRARAIKSQVPLSGGISTAQAKQAASDYRKALILTSREEWDTDEELVEDGASRNPYAAWEWGSVARYANDWDVAAYAHDLAANSFDEIGDKARAVISRLDSGIDYAAASTGSGDSSSEKAIAVLSRAVPQTKGVESRDVALLQRVLAKEGEGRIALAATLWETPGGRRNDAETYLGDACVRLEQMQVDAATTTTTQQKQQRSSSSNSMNEIQKELQSSVSPLSFSIDDDNGVPVRDVSCYKFRDPKFLSKLGWSDSLQKKVNKLQTLK